MHFRFADASVHFFYRVLFEIAGALRVCEIFYVFINTLTDFASHYFNEKVGNISSMRNNRSEIH